ncbi:MAG TPA: hypothetical protein VFH45_13030 [Acidimicrobiales bacterium]|nr:hypothetical protein [Acidimicrobiales bacterium]
MPHRLIWVPSPRGANSRSASRAGKTRVSPVASQWMGRITASPRILGSPTVIRTCLLRMPEGPARTSSASPSSVARRAGSANQSSPWRS